MLATLLSATLHGLDGRVIRVEVDVAPGLPGFTIVGLEVDDDTRGRVFAFFQSTIQAILLAVIAGAGFIATGFSGHGLQQAPAVGRGLAELVTRGRYVTLDLSPLGYDRVTAGQPLREENVV